MAQIVGFYVCSGHQILDLAGPIGAFDLAGHSAGQTLYQMQVLSRGGGLVSGSAGVSIETLAIDAVAPDTLIVVGGDILPMSAPAEVDAVRRAATRTSRLASVCTGTFLLAETGLLDSKRVTTHWEFAGEFQRRYPRVTVDADCIFVADGHLWTSAGITAGIDLALALIEADHGVELARAVARQLVVYHRRSGGQSQFAAVSNMEPESDRIRIALTYARDHLTEDLTIASLADVAKLSGRQFTRAFKRETGATPAKAVERLRVEAAHVRLREGSEPIELIARMVGFVDAERMRRAFINVHGQPPQAIRRLHRSNARSPGSPTRVIP
ncbi:GlxA family transcriptional regulator [Methylobacterium sp. WL69]|uniref:GlxA family transcriptional regulator n=1 Tax=Methylobacterium sp. WL69 TaxID=2603893 RepID=UPI001FEFD65D|nr:GlxA family transcriptional regulator [Methylobacterium sp. WL69]